MIWIMQAHKQKLFHVKNAVDSSDIIIGMQALIYHVIASHMSSLLKLVCIFILFSPSELLDFICNLSVSIMLGLVVSVSGDQRRSCSYHPPSVNGNVCVCTV